MEEKYGVWATTGEERPDWATPEHTGTREECREWVAAMSGYAGVDWTTYHVRPVREIDPDLL